MNAENEKLKVGLALSGGAARGFAHLGVLKVLAQHDIPIDMIAGTSAGAMAGGAFAAGIAPDELFAFGKTLRWRGLGKLTLSRGGFQTNLPFEEFLRSRLPVTRFEDLLLPFAAVATDLQTGDEVVFKEKGDVPFAIRASCTLPGLYVPVIDAHGRQLVDGGLVANIPVEAVRDLGANFIIAVDVNAEGAKFLGTPQSSFGILMQSFVLVQRSIAARDLRHAQVAIRPRIGHIRWDEITKADELMRLGAEAAREAIPEIKRQLQAAEAVMV